MTKAKSAISTIIDNIDIVVEAVKARDLLVGKQFDAAKVICTRLIESSKWSQASDTTKILVLYFRGTSHSQQKQYDEALLDLEEALKIDRENVRVLSLQGEAFLAKGQLNKANDCYEKVTGKNHALNVATYTNQAAIKLRLKDYTGALVAVQNALSIDPKNVAALQNGALVLSALGRIKKMQEYVDRLQTVDPNLPVGHYLRGKVNHHFEKYAEAIASYNKAIAGKFLLNGVVYHLRAAANSCLGFDNEVLKDCDESLKIQPDNFTALSLKGYTLSRMGRNAEATEILKRQLLLEIDDKSRAEAHLNLSMLLLKIGDVTSALSECAKVLEFDPENATAHNNRAWIFAHRKDYKEALLEIEKVSNEQELSTNFLSTRGFIYFLNDRIEDAKRDFDASLAKNPSTAEALFHRAIIFQREGDAKTASEYFARAKAMDFKNPSFSQLKLPDDVPSDWNEK